MQDKVNRLLDYFEQNKIFSPVNKKYHKILQTENMKAAPYKSHFLLIRFEFFHIIKGKIITPLKSRINAVLKLQPPSNKKHHEIFGLLIFLSKFVY